MPETITPLGDRVIIEIEQYKEWRGIHIPEDVTHKENPFDQGRIGVVQSLGTGDNINVKVGDRVLLPNGFPKAKRFEMAGRTLWSFNADTLLGVLERAT